MAKVLIHVGKCGGKSLRELSGFKALKFKEVVHVRPPVYTKDTAYYILLRDPINRVVSAFCYMYTLIPTMEDKRKTKFKTDWKMLRKYDSINNLAEQLYDYDDKLVPEVSKEAKSIRHMDMNISFYLTEFLKKCPMDKIKVIMQESYDKDIKRHLNLEHFKPTNVTKPGKSKFLSRRSLRNLAMWLKEDYDCIFKLGEAGKIDKDVLHKITERYNKVLKY